MNQEDIYQYFINQAVKIRSDNMTINEKLDKYQEIRETLLSLIDRIHNQKEREDIFNQVNKKIILFERELRN